MRDAVEDRRIETLIDEIGHVSFQRLSMGRAGLAPTKALLPIVARGLSRSIPEAIAALARRGLPRPCLTTKDGDPMSMPSSIATPARCAALVLGAVLGAGAPPPARAEPPAQELEAAATPPDALLGEWWTEGREGRFRFVRSPDGTYAGILVGTSHPGTDVHNKDPALRDRPLLGATLIWHLRPEDGEYADGYVYNPRNGETYRMKAELTGKTTLRIRGYLGISLLGQSQTWTRAN